MSVSIASCPQCKSLLLSDTAQCPSCHHVLNPQHGTNLAEQKLHSEVKGSGPDEIPCPDCGEMVRKELVRCWRCGGFLRQEMAETYQRMRENAQLPAAPVLREIPTPIAQRQSSVPVSSLPPLADDDDDDFSLGEGVVSIPFSATSSQGASDPLPASEGSYELAPIPDLSTPSVGVAAAETSPSATETPVGGATAESAPSPKAAASPATEAPGEAHSVATAGDVLLDIAKQEEIESEKRRKDRGKRKPGSAGGRGGFVIFCPYGHQIEVQEKHRGQMGKCPRCKSAFIVPMPLPEEKPAEAAAVAGDQAAAVAEQPGALAAGKFTRWMKDVRIHPLDPTKLKLKPGSLESAFDTQDLGFGLDGILLLTLVKKGSMFGSAEKKKPEAREAAVAHLAAGKPLTELAVAAQRLFGPDMLKQIQVVQPAMYAHESMFAGIPVFGNNRIAVRLPKPPEGVELLFASFWLSEFREFNKQMEEVFEITGLGDDLNLPLTDKFNDYKCHYTDASFQALDNVEYHQADPNIKLVIVGRKCEGCGLVISEDGRKKEKLGGADGKGIAKAKCPKCQKKFGSITFYNVEAPAAPESPAAAT